MTFGLDFVSGPAPSVLKAVRVDGNPVTFVCRYLSAVNEQTKRKLLTPEEAKANSQAGIALVSNYEWYKDRATKGTAAGIVDAHIAAKQHADCGGPADRPIYFSVDIDTDGASVAAYFQGVASVLGLSRTGAYGNYRVLKYLFDNGLIQWGWQTYAWSHGEWEPRAHIQQYENSVQLAGHEVDYDRAIKDDYGQWLAGESLHVIENTGGDLQLLQLSDPMGKHFTELAPDRWHCTNTGVDLAYAHLDFYRRYEGILRLPLTNEIYLAQLPKTAIVCYEGAIAIYDPGNVAQQKPTGSGNVYLLKINEGLGQQIIAKPLVAALNQEVSDLQAKLAAAPAQADLDKLHTQLAAYQAAAKQAISLLQPLEAL